MMINVPKIKGFLKDTFSRVGLPYASGEIVDYRIAGDWRTAIDIDLNDGKTVRMGRALTINNWDMESIAMDSSYTTAFNEGRGGPTPRTLTAIVSPFKNTDGSQRVLALLSLTPQPPPVP